MQRRFAKGPFRFLGRNLKNRDFSHRTTHANKTAIGAHLNLKAFIQLMTIHADFVMVSINIFLLNRIIPYNDFKFNLFLLINDPIKEPMKVFRPGH